MKLKQTAIFITAFSIIAAFLVLPAIAEGSFTSSGTVKFGAKEETPPVDPENPTEPQVPPEVPGTGQEGNLTLDVVPNPNFGEYPVPTLNTTYSSKIVAGIGNALGEASAQSFIQVSDARADSSAGWDVKVKAAAFADYQDQSDKINGAKIIFTAGSVNGPSGSNAPVSYAVTLNCIDGGGTQNEETIFDAQPGNGIGTWVSRLYPSPLTDIQVGDDNDFIQLFIPANSGAIENTTYSADIIWTLSVAP